MLFPALSAFMRRSVVSIVWSVMMSVPSEQVVRVILENSEVVHSLETQVSELTSELSQIRAQLHSTEFRYNCEATQNMAIKDWCRMNGIKLPERFF